LKELTFTPEIKKYELKEPKKKAALEKSMKAVEQYV
jgi:hypothetical protein